MESGTQREEPRPIRRRAFIGRVAKKAAYVAPAGISGCGEAGSPCTTDADCCAGFICEIMGAPCTSEPECECEPV